MGWDGLPGTRRRNHFLRELVLAHIARPRRKRGTVMDLPHDMGITLDLDRIHQTMDQLYDSTIDSIRRLSHDRARDLLPEPPAALFLHRTTLKFGSGREDPADDPDRPSHLSGYGRNGKPHRIQVVLAVLLTTEGLPVDYEMFHGILAEGGTLKPVIEALTGRHAVGTITIVADADRLIRENRDLLGALKLPHFLGFRPGSATAGIQQRILTAKASAPGFLHRRVAATVRQRLRTIPAGSSPTRVIASS